MVRKSIEEVQDEVEELERELARLRPSKERRLDFGIMVALGVLFAVMLICAMLFVVTGSTG